MKTFKQVTVYDLAMTFIPNIGHSRAKTLISHCGSAKEVFKKSQSFLDKIPGIGPIKGAKIRDKSVLLRAEKELTFVERHKIKPLFFLNDDFPTRLLNINDAPVLLYYKGNANLNASRNIGIVGTRTPSERGKLHTERLVDGLKTFGANVYSGMAYGIDACAHKKCMDIGVPTIGVMGTGLDMIYPSAHKSWGRKMIDKGGLLTEFPSKTIPDRQNFPMRNRIIAALCDAIVVIESKRKGGSMITANLANDYNKDVFAIPGRPDDENAKGCNHLIKSHTAHLMENIEDLAYTMMWEQLDIKKEIQTSLFLNLTEDENLIVNKFKTHTQLSIDKIISELNFTPSKLASILLNLEFKGVIRALPGKRYILIG